MDCWGCPRSSCNFEKTFKMLSFEEKVEIESTRGKEKSPEDKKNDTKTSKTADLLLPEALSTTKDSPRGEMARLYQQTNRLTTLRDVAVLFLHQTGRHHVPKPYEKITDAIFYDEIHASLRLLNFQTIYRTQAYSWPVNLELGSVFIINNEKSGKTFSYLPALLTNLMSWSIDTEPIPGNGPIGVIIVRSSREAEILHKYCTRLVPRGKLSIVQAFGMWNCDNQKVDLLNGCDLLITTPPCFSRLAEGETIKLFSKERIKHLVFDDLDSMHDLFENDIRNIVRTCTFGENEIEKNPQLIVTSTSWKNYLRKYMRLAYDPLVIIGSFVEAAVYAKCRFSLSLVKGSHQEKLERLASFVNTNRWKSKKTLIVFNTQGELDAAVADNRSCWSSCSEFHVVGERVLPDEVEEMLHFWHLEKPGNMSIMLTIDRCLLELVNKIKTVEILIHFSLPSNWSKFSRRFATMNNSFLKVVTGDTAERPATIVLLDERNAKEIPRLIDFVETRQVISQVPEDIKNLVTLIINDREAEKREDQEIAPICSNVYQFGKCENIYSCHQRHAFVEADTPVNIPVDGLVKFELVCVQNPALFTIKILEYLPAGEGWISCEKKILKTEDTLSDLQKTMQEISVIQTGVKINDICAVFCTKLHEWGRCKVLEKQKTEDPANFKAKVVFIDHGHREVVQSTDLKVLPEYMKLVDPLVADLRILNLIPYDRDTKWDHLTTAQLKKFFSKKENLGDFMLAQVEFTVQNTIFATTFEIRCHYDELNTDVTKYSLTVDLLKKKYCLRDVNIAEELKKLVKQANLFIPQKNVEVKAKEIKKMRGMEAQPKWKHLTIGSEYQVYVKHFETPDLFYVCLDDSENQVLRQLMKQVEGCEARNPLETAKEGKFGLVVKEGSKPQRGLITERQDEGSFKVFLLDFGVFIICRKSDLYELPVAVINAFPFQAIQCRLKGVKPLFHLADWPKRGLREIRRFVSDFCGNFLFNMRVVARDLSESQNAYDVVLFETRSRKILHRALVEEEMADQDRNFDDATVFDSSDGFKDLPAKVPELDLIEQSLEVQEMWEFMNRPSCDFNLIHKPVQKLVGPATVDAKKIPFKFSILKAKSIQSSLQQPTNAPPAPEATSSLSYINKHPTIEWRQNAIMIWLSFSAVDSVDYGLSITDSTLTIRIMYNDDKPHEYTTLQLFGVVFPQQTSHEKAGEKIIVRLLKALTMPWTRLTSCDEPNRFITFNFEPVPDIISQNKVLFNPRPAGASDDESEGSIGSDEAGYEDD